MVFEQLEASEKQDLYKEARSARRFGGKGQGDSDVPVSLSSIPYLAIF